MKYQELDEIRIGDIVRLYDASFDGYIGHRVVKIQKLSDETYYLETKGGANQYFENWYISAGAKIAKLYARIGYTHHALDFLASRFGVIINGGLVVILWIILLYQRWSSSRIQKPSSNS